MALLAAIGLLVLLVVLLHRHQTLQMQHNADRNLPLPPLRKTPADINRERPAATPTPSPDIEPTDGESDDHPLAVPETPAVEKEPDEDRGPSWYERLAQLKRDGQLTEALILCRQEFPLWSAFQQAMLVKRAQIKQLQQADQDFSAELRELYHIASVGSLLHDRAKGTRDLTLPRLKLLNLKNIFELDMPYEQIGYLHLRLIKKTDIKLLVDAWGKPEQHQSPRLYHGEFWRAVAGSPASLH